MADREFASALKNEKSSPPPTTPGTPAPRSASHSSGAATLELFQVPRLEASPSPQSRAKTLDRGSLSSWNRNARSSSPCKKKRVPVGLTSPPAELALIPGSELGGINPLVPARSVFPVKAGDGEGRKAELQASAWPLLAPTEPTETDDRGSKASLLLPGKSTREQQVCSRRQVHQDGSHNNAAQWPSLDESRGGGSFPLPKASGPMDPTLSTRTGRSEGSKKPSTVGGGVEYETSRWLRAVGKQEEVTRDFWEVQRWPTLLESENKKHDAARQCIVVEDDAKKDAVGTYLVIELQKDASGLCEVIEDNAQNDAAGKCRVIEDDVQEDAKAGRYENSKNANPQYLGSVFDRSECSSTLKSRHVRALRWAVAFARPHKRLRPRLCDFWANTADPQLVLRSRRAADPDCNPEDDPSSSSIVGRARPNAAAQAGAQPVLVMLNTDFIVASPVRENLLLTIALTQRRRRGSPPPAVDQGAELRQLAAAAGGQSLRQQQVLVGQFTALASFLRFGLCPDALRVKYEQNAGGSSTISESLSVEYFARRFQARDVVTEMEVEYQSMNWKKVDYICTLYGKRVGVSVTRAMSYPDPKAFSADAAYRLLYKKLNGLVVARTGVTTRHSFSQCILHVWCETQRTAEIMVSKYKAVLEELDITDDVIMVLTIAEGYHARPIFYEHTVHDVWTSDMALKPAPSL